jgi:hypothetical protein
MNREENIGQPVELKEPYKGYRYGTICGYDQYHYVIELTSGYIGKHIPIQKLTVVRAHNINPGYSKTEKPWNNGLNGTMILPRL